MTYQRSEFNTVLIQVLQSILNLEYLYVHCLIGIRLYCTLFKQIIFLHITQEIEWDIIIGSLELKQVVVTSYQDVTKFSNHKGMINKSCNKTTSKIAWFAVPQQTRNIISLEVKCCPWHHKLFKQYFVKFGLKIWLKWY